jgi:hypothetical protein
MLHVRRPRPDRLPTVESSEAQRQVSESDGPSLRPLEDKYSAMADIQVSASTHRAVVNASCKPWRWRPAIQAPLRACRAAAIVPRSPSDE